MTPAIIQITPDPIAVSFGPFNIGWYGIAYVVALAVLLFVSICLFWLALTSPND